LEQGFEEKKKIEKEYKDLFEKYEEMRGNYEQV